MKRHGAVIVFKKGVGPKRAAEALAKLFRSGVLDLDYYVKQEPAALVREFDSDDGGPVWYIP